MKEELNPQTAAALRPVGARIKQWREARQKSQSQLALECDIQQSDVSRIERAEQAPRFEVLVRVAAALDITLERLFASEKEKDSPATALALKLTDQEINILLHCPRDRLQSIFSLLGVADGRQRSHKRVSIKFGERANGKRDSRDSLRTKRTGPGVDTDR